MHPDTFLSLQNLSADWEVSVASWEPWEASVAWEVSEGVATAAAAAAATTMTTTTATTMITKEIATARMSN